MQLKKWLIWFITFIFLGLLLIMFAKFSAESPFQISSGGEKIIKEKIIERQIEDITEKISYYTIKKEEGKQAKIKLTVREFPNGDKMLYVEARSNDYLEPIQINLPFRNKATITYTEDTAISELYPYRKARKLPDPLSTKLHYIENNDNSMLIGTSIYFNDISYTYDNGKTSHVMEFEREADTISYEEDAWKFNVQFRRGETQFSTWMMLSKEQLIENKDQFQQIHKISADEFRWITPNTLWSHRVESTFPKTDNAFVSSLVRQSGRASAIMLGTEPSRVWENINRHHFASLETSRSDDGLWHSNYTSTWLEHAYGFGPEYIDSRHNDNIFRSQLKRSELLGYKSYAKERSVYADFLIDMANAGYTIPNGSGYYLVDYYNLEEKTHASLNHALSLMNYQYEAYHFLKDDKYLDSAEAQFAAFLETGTDWINEENTFFYQMNLDRTMTGKDYNLVTYYDLLYTKKLRQELKLPSSNTLDFLIKVKQQNLYKKGVPIEGTFDNVENFIGLIE